MCISNNQLPEQLNNFLTTYLATIKEASKNTIEGYTSDLVIFFKFMKAYKNNLNTSNLDEIDISNINVQFIKLISLTDIYAFMNYLETERNNGSRTRGRKVASLKSFYAYLQAKEKVITEEENPTIELEKPENPKRNPIYLTIDESKKLLETIEEYAKGDYYYERDYCIITLFLNCGLRLSELRDINVEDIKNDTLNIVGKGDKQRIIYLNEMCVKALNTWLSVRQERKINKEDENALFISKQGNRMDKKTIENMVKKYVKLSGVNPKCTCHKLRHTSATSKYKSGVDIRVIQKMLGHSSISTTTIYTHVDDEKLREAANVNPFE